jgi:hypothetical protein
MVLGPYRIVVANCPNPVFANKLIEAFEHGALGFECGDASGKEDNGFRYQVALFGGQDNPGVNWILPIGLVNNQVESLRKFAPGYVPSVDVRYDLRVH